MRLSQALKTAYKASVFLNRVGLISSNGRIGRLAKALNVAGNILEEIQTKGLPFGTDSAKRSNAVQGNEFNTAEDLLNTLNTDRSVGIPSNDINSKNPNSVSTFTLEVAALADRLEAGLADQDQRNASHLNDMDPNIPGLSADAVCNGMFIGNSLDLAHLIRAGEKAHTRHIPSEFITRSSSSKTLFMNYHGYNEIPSGYDLHHIVPLCEGGRDHPSNMVLVREAEHARITAAHRSFYRWQDSIE